MVLLSLPMPMTLRFTKHTSSFCVITFMLKYLESSYFSNKMMDLVNIWYDVRYQSKVSKFSSVCLFIHSSIGPSNAIRGADFP